MIFLRYGGGWIRCAKKTRVLERFQVLASNLFHKCKAPKGGVGKSTCAVLLASEFARMGADVTALDCDPNKSLTRWASHGLPKSVTLYSDVGRSDRTIIELIPPNSSL